MNHPEADLQRLVLEHVAWRKMPGLWCCHIPNEGDRGDVGNAIAVALGLVPGAPDLFFLYRGACHFLELKAKGKKPNKKQIEVMNDLEMAGARVAWTDNIDTALAILEGWGLLKRNHFYQPQRKAA